MGEVSVCSQPPAVRSTWILRCLRAEEGGTVGVAGHRLVLRWPLLCGSPTCYGTLV